MHDTVMEFATRVLTPPRVGGKRVLEVGSYNVNGSVRPHVMSLGPDTYLGVDAHAGPGVDRVVDCEYLSLHFVAGTWDLVITTEMLEHVENWRLCMREMTAMLPPGGLLLLTTRSPGFPYHPYPDDFWRYTNAQMRSILSALRLQAVVFEDDPQPGVLVLARKPNPELSIRHNCLNNIDVERVMR